MSTLQDRIREAIGFHSLAHIAKETGRTPSAVSQWVDGSIKTLRADTAMSLESATGYRATWLITGKGPKRVLDDDETEFAGRARNARRVPVVGTAKLGDDGFYEEISSVTGAGDGHIEIATEDPNAYCLRVRGMSMFPAIRDGWYVLIEPNGTPREGEYVLLKLLDGRKMVKELLFRRNGSVEVMSVNGDVRFAIDLTELQDMQAVGAVISPSKWRPD